MGSSGESYAFNPTGKLISESRFTSDLQDLALVPTFGQSILTVDVRDPGGNLLEGFRSPVLREKQPLTLMARSAIESGSGENLQGYNDYRGVPVIGAWNWLTEYGFGITTEIDVEEAFRQKNLINQGRTWSTSSPAQERAVEEPITGGGEDPQP